MYHVTDQGPRVCKAVMGKCPYVKQQNSHFNDQASAYNEYENRLSKEYGNLGKSVAKRVNQSALQKHYRRFDKLEKTSPMYKVLADRQKLRRYTPTRRNSRKFEPQRGNRRRSKTLGSRLRRGSSRLLRKQTRKFTRAIAPNSRNIKKMLLVKYWMPDIRSNKWR